MANNTAGNPLFADTTGALITKPTRVLSIQWIDDNGDIVHDSTLTLRVNGISFTVKIQPVNDQLGFGGVAYEANFGPGTMINDLNVTAMAQGNLLVWKA